MIPHILIAAMSNPVFAGVGGAAVVSAGLYQIRALPGQIWAVLHDQFSATLVVYSEQEAFRQLDMWIGRHPSAAKARRLALAERWDQLGDKQQFETTMGPGPHILWEGRAPIFLSREVQDGPNAGGGPRKQTITLTTMGRSRALIERIVAEARTVEERDAVAVYVWRGHYQLIERRRRRALESVHLAPGLRERIVADAHRFVEAKDWYGDRGIPHRRGYLFEGPPGTGKSSMALALAGELRKSIYIINPSTLDDDNDLQGAINAAGSGVVLIEDIDAINGGRDRTKQRRNAMTPGAVDEPSGNGITTSGLLNALDGVAAREGRVLVITSNHADKLDPALIRPGRVDMRCAFEPAGHREALAMFQRFFPDRDAKPFIAEIGGQLPLSQAEIQNRLLRIAA